MSKYGQAESIYLSDPKDSEERTCNCCENDFPDDLLIEVSGSYVCFDCIEFGEVENPCTYCNGSGEGYYEDSTCQFCHGKGSQRVQYEE